MRNILRQALTAAVLSAGLAGTAQAGLVTVNTVACSNIMDGFCDSSAFDAAVGSPVFDESLDFRTDINGDTVINGNVLGDIFSNNVHFSTVGSPVFGNFSGPFVGTGANGTRRGMGPANTFNGILRIDFLQPVIEVGFISAFFNTQGSIRIFDTNNDILGSFAGLSDDILDFVGLIATDGDAISRIELDDNPHGIQTLRFNFATPPSTGNPVPEPTSMALLGLGLAGLMVRHRRRGRDAAIAAEE